MTPDLTTMGKAVANAYPACILCGREEYIEAFDMLGDAMTDIGSAGVLYGGSFMTHAASVAAVTHCIRLIEEQGFHPHVNQLCDLVTAGTRNLIEDLRITAAVQRYEGIWIVYFSDGSPREMGARRRTERIAISSISQSVGGTGSPRDADVRRNYLTGSHSEEDVLRTIEVAEVVLESVAK